MIDHLYALMKQALTLAEYGGEAGACPVCNGLPHMESCELAKALRACAEASATDRWLADLIDFLEKEAVEEDGFVGESFVRDAAQYRKWAQAVRSLLPASLRAEALAPSTDSATTDVDTRPLPDFTTADLTDVLQAIWRGTPTTPNRRRELQQYVLDLANRMTTGRPQRAAGNECDLTGKETCVEAWPQDPASWCAGCRAERLLRAIGKALGVDLSEDGLQPLTRTSEESGECCMKDHANAVPPWTCKCLCHSTPATQENP
jgi:hypothetical protein